MYSKRTLTSPWTSLIATLFTESLGNNALYLRSEAIHVLKKWPQAINGGSASGLNPLVVQNAIFSSLSRCRLSFALLSSFFLCDHNVLPFFGHLLYIPPSGSGSLTWPLLYLSGVTFPPDSPLLPVLPLYLSGRLYVVLRLTPLTLSCHALLRCYFQFIHQSSNPSYQSCHIRDFPNCNANMSRACTGLMKTGLGDRECEQGSRY